MPATDERFQFLFRQFAESKSSQEELQEFYRLLNGVTDNDMAQLMNDHYGKTRLSDHADGIDWNDMFRQITQKKENMQAGKFSWKKLSAAAAILIMLGAGIYVAFLGKPAPGEKVVQVREQRPDIKPPSNAKAVITLANGKQIVLDSAANGPLATQGEVSIVKRADGKIAYSGVSGALMYNTLSNPRGSRVVDITLEDGTRVWLNAGSSLTYPVAFAGNERKVQMTGEAYFEVSHDAAKKFLVDAGGTITQVLGTQFNINSYTDESTTTITLLHGSIKVSRGHASDLLIPGQQAQVNNSIHIASNIDTGEVIAWKDGRFQFGDKADVKAIMRQISRWYDVEVEYRGETAGHIGGGISRNVNAAQVFKMLEATGVARFHVEGRKVIVTTP